MKNVSQTIKKRNKQVTKTNERTMASYNHREKKQFSNE